MSVSYTHLDVYKRQPLTIEKVICRRGIFEFQEDSFINLGIGLPMNVSNVLNEEGLIDDVSASIESGVMGGVPAPGIATGAAYNPDAILKQPDMFDFYDGGGIDFACLGSAEIDMHGNVKDVYKRQVEGHGVHHYPAHDEPVEGESGRQASDDAQQHQDEVFPEHV